MIKFVRRIDISVKNWIFMTFVCESVSFIYEAYVCLDEPGLYSRENRAAADYLRLVQKILTNIYELGHRILLYRGPCFIYQSNK